MLVKDTLLELLAAGFFLCLVVYNVLMLIDPVRTTEAEQKYLWSGQRFVGRANPEELIASARKRLGVRLGASAFLVLLLAVAYAISTMGDHPD